MKEPGALIIRDREARGELVNYLEAWPALVAFDLPDRLDGISDLLREAFAGQAEALASLPEPRSKRACSMHFLCPVARR